MQKTQKVLFLCVLGLFSMHFSMAQDGIKKEFDQMMEKSSTYEQYKVIKITEINEFWARVESTLDARTANIQRLQNQLEAVDTQVDSLQAELARVNVRLNETLEEKDSIVFLGLSMEKTAYHIFVWIIIVALAVLCVMAYLMYIKSNKTTTRIKREYSGLSKEFEAHKDKARETQVKLKRELQTAVNSIDEIKRGGGRR